MKNFLLKYNPLYATYLNIYHNVAIYHVYRIETTALEQPEAIECKITLPNWNVLIAEFKIHTKRWDFLHGSGWNTLITIHIFQPLPCISNTNMMWLVIMYLTIFIIVVLAGSGKFQGYIKWNFICTYKRLNLHYMKLKSSTFQLNSIIECRKARSVKPWGIVNSHSRQIP